MPMGLTGALLVGGLLLVVLTGAVIAFLVERIRDSRLIRALNEAVTGMKSVEFERREELHYLCTELLHLSGTESTQLIDALLDGEKHQLGTLIRTVLERDMDALSGYHEQLADFTTLQLRRTGEALRRTQLENATDAEPDSVDIEIEPASASDSTPSEPEPSTEPTGWPESDDVEPSIPGQVESQEAQAPADAPSETEATVALVTDEANSSSPLLTPEEIEKEIWGELTTIEPGNEPESEAIVESSRADEIVAEEFVGTRSNGTPEPDFETLAPTETAPLVDTDLMAELNSVELSAPPQVDEIDALLAAFSPISPPAEAVDPIPEAECTSDTEPNGTGEVAGENIAQTSQQDIVSPDNVEPAEPTNAPTKEAKKKRKKRKASDCVAVFSDTFWDIPVSKRS